MPRWFEASRERGSALDRRWALSLQRSTTRHALLWLLVCSSWLVEAPVWLLLALLLPLLDPVWGGQVARQLLLLGSVNLALFAALKFSTRRARPFQQCEGIECRSHAADGFGFPSGHALHAVAFAALLSAWYPQLALPLALLAALVLLSGVVLGVHYPSDVLAGAMVGLCSAATLLWLTTPAA